MTDRIISPDGKFMWTGSEWIPAPPAATENKQTDIFEALSLSESARAQEAKIVGFTELRLGDAAREKGNWTLALEYWNRIIEGDGHQIDAEIRINAMINTAGYYIMRGNVGKDWIKNLEMADKILNQALHHSRKNNNKKMEVFTLMKLSECIYSMSQRINAEYFNINDYVNTKDIISPLYSPIHSWEKDYVDCIEKTMNFFDSAISVAIELSDSELQALVKCNKSQMLTGLIRGFDHPLGNQVPRLLLWEGKILLANIESDMQFVLDVATMHTNLELKCEAYEVLAWVHYLRGERNDAKRYNKMMLEIFNSLPDGTRFHPKLFPRI